MIKLYNTLSGKKEELPDQKKLRLFVCGPTVYDFLHIGNARTYIFFDFFAKYLHSQGYDVFYLQNITDIDDKIIRRASEEQEEPAKLAKKFTEAYFDDMKSLGVTAVTKYAPATNFIT
jgi:cysteinyl-tRNA synthetase